jgi:hypothetical protein
VPWEGLEQGATSPEHPVKPDKEVLKKSLLRSIIVVSERGVLFQHYDGSTVEKAYVIVLISLGTKILSLRERI